MVKKEKTIKNLSEDLEKIRKRRWHKENFDALFLQIDEGYSVEDIRLKRELDRLKREFELIKEDINFLENSDLNESPNGKFERLKKEFELLEKINKEKKR